MNNSHKEKTLDHQNLNLLDTINGFSQKSEGDSLKDAHEITDFKKHVNNNNNNNNYNNMPPNQPDVITEAAGKDNSCGLPLYLPENQPGGDLKYDLSTLHLSDKPLLPFKHVLDAECESVHSDYSEVVGPLRDLADNDIDIFQAEDLQKENLAEKCNTYSIGNKTLKQQPDETDEEFKKRVKKVNFLSLAQEFAELKKIDADVLPFDLHKTNLCDYSPMSEESSLAESALTTPVEPGQELLCSYEYVKDENSNELDSVDCCDPETIISDDKEIRSSLKPKDLTMTDSSKVSPRRGKPNLPLWENKPKYNSANNELNDDEQECEIYDMENTLPKMDWETLELQLAMAAEEKERLSHFNDREEIRRKLAMGGDEECYTSERLFKKSSMQPRHQGDLNLQLCFMNDAAAIPQSSDSSGSDYESASRPTPPLPPPPKTNLLSHLSVLKPKYLSDHSLHHPPNKPPRKKGDGENEEEDFFRKQARLQEEAKLALAQASTMAHMQLEVEKQMKKKSPIAEMVGIPGFGDGRQKRLHRKILLDMNVAQLQVIVNDLLSQIKSLNEDLVQMLLDRDDLHMEQDSMLVDIEDLTRRAQDFAKKINSKQKKDKKK